MHLCNIRFIIKSPLDHLGLSGTALERYHNIFLTFLSLRISIVSCDDRLSGSFTVKSSRLNTKPGKLAILNAHLQPSLSTMKLKAKAKLYPIYTPKVNRPSAIPLCSCEINMLQIRKEWMDDWIEWIDSWWVNLWMNDWMDWQLMGKSMDEWLDG